jgi:glycosyltransferase involved in cell wall biosynthesis
VHNGASVWGGAEYAQAVLLAGLARRGHDAVYYCSHGIIAREAAACGVETRIERLGGDYAVHDVLRFARTLRGYKPDVLIVGLYRKLWLAGLASRLAKVPRFVARIEKSGDLPLRGKYRLVFRHLVDDIVCVSHELRREFIDAGFAERRVKAIYAGIEFGEPAQPPGSVKRSLGLAPDTSVVGAIGRLSHQKRFDRLLRSFARLDENPHCIIAGEGEEREALESLASELGISDRVHFLGFRRDIPDVLASMDVLAITSDLEGLSIAMVEALASGVPVVSTPVVGPRETLNAAPGDTPPGLLVGFDDAELAAALERLLGDAGLRRAMGDVGVRLARERFSLETMLDRWEEVLSAASQTAR